MSGLKLDLQTARALLRTAPRMKPKGVARVYCPGTDFEFDECNWSAGASLVLTSSGDIRVEGKQTIEDYFEPVAKRTRKATS